MERGGMTSQDRSPIRLPALEVAARAAASREAPERSVLYLGFRNYSRKITLISHEYRELLLWWFLFFVRAVCDEIFSWLNLGKR
jgi:hypothetical protein